MERYLLQFMLVMVAFSGGDLLVNGWLNELSSKYIEIEAADFKHALAYEGLKMEISRNVSAAGF
jgi:hypothetical protein